MALSPLPRDGTLNIKAVAFDMGDTLVMTDTWSYDKSLRRLLQRLRRDGADFSTPFKEFKRVYFEVRNQLYEQSEPSLEEVDFRLRIAQTLRRFNCPLNPESPLIAAAVEGFMEAFIEDSRVEEYAPDLLSNLRQRYKLGVVSNFAYALGPKRILQHHGLARFFDAILASGELGVRKPHPRIFEQMLSRLSVKANETIFVGDSLKADINGAKNVGMRAVLVENVGLRKNPFAIAGELDPFSVEPDATIPCLEKLPSLLKTMQSL